MIHDLGKLKRIAFRVDPPILGYRASARRAHDPRYKQFKNRVLMTAMEAGFIGKVVAIKEAPPFLSVRAYWRKNPRIDWKNVYGGIEDSLFSEDTFVVPGPANDSCWDTGEEYVEVFLDVPRGGI